MIQKRKAELEGTLSTKHNIEGNDTLSKVGEMQQKAKIDFSSVMASKSDQTAVSEARGKENNTHPRQEDRNNISNQQVLDRRFINPNTEAGAAGAAEAKAIDDGAKCSQHNGSASTTSQVQEELGEKSSDKPITMKHEQSKGSVESIAQPVMELRTYDNAVFDMDEWTKELNVNETKPVVTDSKTEAVDTDNWEAELEKEVWLHSMIIPHV